MYSRIIKSTKQSHLLTLSFPFRINNRPFLGICLGLQCAVVEFARNVLGMKGAASTEIDPETPEPVVIDMPEHNPGQGRYSVLCHGLHILFYNI